MESNAGLVHEKGEDHYVKNRAISYLSQHANLYSALYSGLTRYRLRPDECLLLVKGDKKVVITRLNNMNTSRMYPR